MQLEKRIDGNKINTRWRCSAGGCRKSKSILIGTIFEKSKLSISIIMQIIYMHCLEIKVRYITSELNVSEQAVYSIVNIFYKKIDEDDYNYTFDKLGGPEAIIEVDETHIVSRKDNRGRILAGERYWIIGAICRETKNIALQVVRRRTSVICSNFVRSNIDTSSRVMTDCWKGYGQLSYFGYNHDTINHKKHFVDPDDPTIHTQNIERLWKTFKEKYANSNNFNYLCKAAKRFTIEKNLSLKLPCEKFEFLSQINLLP
ncbi:hypothetical protein ENBRE01_0270 [Enteropsectra breve]|nr:hypothetical protein ENBRE01_0270 [Enteropsectra breve]